MNLIDLAIDLFTYFMHTILPKVVPDNLIFALKRFMIDLKVLDKSVGLCQTSKRKDQLYISLLVFVWRIICENINPNGLLLAEI